jgi:hypothetical protein
MRRLGAIHAIPLHEACASGPQTVEQVKLALQMTRGKGSADEGPTTTGNDKIGTQEFSEDA